MSSPIVRPTAFSVVALSAGLLFGAGLVLSGMTLPSKVRGFLDFAGAWDPTLMFVMGGAIGVHSLAYAFTRGWRAPLLASRFQLPTRRDLDAKLLLGAAVFGVGWGVGGYCPGPAVVSLTTGAGSALAFVASMLFASWITGQFESRSAAGAPTSESVAPAAEQERPVA